MGLAIGGSAIQVRWNGEIVGWCTRADYSNPRTVVSVEPLGEEFPTEIAPTGHNAATMGLSMVRIFNRGLHVMGLAPKPGDNNDSMTFPPGVVQLFDRVRDATIVKLEGCQIQASGGSIDARGLMMVNATLMGTRFKDESAS